MRLAIIVAGTAALLASTVAAIGAEDTGVISRVEWGLGTITLDNGHTYIVPAPLQNAVPLRVGDKVKVTYMARVASMVTKVS
jgi:hypothetical protein